MIPDDDQIQTMKSHLTEMGNYEMHGLSQKVQSKIRLEIDAVRSWLLLYDTPDRVQNYQIEQEIRLLTVKHFIYG